MRESWNRLDRRSLLLGVVLVIAGAGPISGEADETAVRLLVTQAGDAWNRGAADSLAAFWTEDGELVAGDATYCKGRQEITNYLTRLLTGSWKGSRFVASVTSVRFVRPDVALVHVDAGFLLPGETELAPERRAAQSLVAVRDGGTWRLALYHSTRARPSSPPQTR